MNHIAATANLQNTRLCTMLLIVENPNRGKPWFQITIKPKQRGRGAVGGKTLHRWEKKLYRRAEALVVGWIVH